MGLGYITGKVPLPTGPDSGIGAQELQALEVASGQVAEARLLTFDLTTDSSFLSDTNITFSGAYGSAALRLQGTYSGATGGYHNIYSIVNMSGAIATNGNGVVGIKSVVVNTAALTDGEVYAGQFIAKHNHASNTMLAAATLIGLEAWGYISAAGQVGTMIGANLGFHNESSGGAIPGSVHRGVQIFCDNASGATKAVESTGLAIWNQAGTFDNAINIINSGNGFTYFVAFTDDGAPAQSSSSSVGNLGTKGWIKVLVGSAVRYISLGDTVS